MRSHKYVTLHAANCLSCLRHQLLLLIAYQCDDAERCVVEPQSGFSIAFNMFDTDGDQRVDKKEFLVVSPAGCLAQMMSGISRPMKYQNCCT